MTAQLRRALLIGVGNYQAMPRLRKTKYDLQSIEEVLNRQDLCAFEDISIEKDISYSEAKIAIDRFFDDDDLTEDHQLLFYFTGHGERSLLQGNKLYLCFSDTDPMRPHVLGLEVTYLRDAMRFSRASARVVILDCCYSGAFDTGVKGGNSSVQIEERFRGSGAYVLTSSDQNEISREATAKESTRDTQPSVFTNAIVEGIKTRSAIDGEGRITTSSLHSYVLTQLRPKQNPRYFSYDQSEPFELVRAKEIAVNEIATEDFGKGDSASAESGKSVKRTRKGWLLFAGVSAVAGITVIVVYVFPVTAKRIWSHVFSNESSHSDDGQSVVVAEEAILRTDCRKTSDRGCSADERKCYTTPPGFSIEISTMSDGSVQSHWQRNPVCGKPEAVDPTDGGQTTSFCADLHVESGSGPMDLGKVAFVSCKYTFSLTGERE